MGPLRLLLVLASILMVSSDGNDTIWKGFTVTCRNDESVSDASVSCHGVRLVRKIVQKFLEDATRKRSLEIFEGVSLVKKDEADDGSRAARNLKGFGPAGSVFNFLEGRELRIKLPSLLPGNIEAAIEGSLPPGEQGTGRGGGGGGGGFGGGKKGDNGVMLMGLMMGKMMAAMGFGALGLLAMKALMVSSMALMLSLIVAAKKLAGGKEEEGHHVVYAQEVSHHHRRRRSLEDLQNQPYRGYAFLSTEMRKFI